ncbi:Na+/H+ antiporter NhaA [Streptomyces chumphonensis]|uniref:Na(+)/H(+) antiporter NhaA n=1 Tax=Streptomyces chumphonensis TaxID=1214925 RepID=A0A927EXG4_9ACTN|nr:Na+/H+ antiporter NhaA [Streptomyces chumphonensis]MBD3930792.1 Na+/H+ antiporter NhaA [Streptomyces chumphonensis]
MTSTQQTPNRRLFARPGLKERRLLADALRTETVGGLMLLGAAIVALVLANTPLSDLYERVSDAHFGIAALDLDLSVAHWASDGLLTIFFFVAGIELKRELVVGELRNPAAAALPVVAAVCGMVVPALFYVAANAGTGGDMNGWAVPMATDIAFALGVLAVIGTNLPSGIRAFLLTLAIVDDLGAIMVIALFYTSKLNLWALAGAIVGLVVFWALHQKLNVRGWYVYVPLALVIWGLMHGSGIHATIAGVAMGMLLRVKTRPGEKESPAEHIEHQVRPISAGFAVPVFAVFAAGVSVSLGDLGEAAGEPEAVGVVLGLFLGKIIGITGGTYLAARFTKAELSDDLSWSDVAGISMLAGIGFTVSLLVTELAFDDAETTEHVKAAVLVASFLSAIVAAVLLKIRDKHYRRIWEEENRDEDGDGIPDIDQREEAELAVRAAREGAARAETARENAARDDASGRDGEDDGGVSGKR